MLFQRRLAGVGVFNLLSFGGSTVKLLFMIGPANFVLVPFSVYVEDQHHSARGNFAKHKLRRQRSSHLRGGRNEVYIGHNDNFDDERTKRHRGRWLSCRSAGSSDCYVFNVSTME